MSTTMTASTSAVSAPATTSILTVRARLVHFDNECVIIPEPERRRSRPRLVTKSYSLPLWRRRNSSAGAASESDAEFDSSVVVKLPIPMLTTKSSAPGETPPLPTPILVHREPSRSPSIDRTPRRTPGRRPSLPLPIAATTVPLRPCCTACFPLIEACAAEGDAWRERFTRGARRRRSLSVDSAGAHAIAHPLGTSGGGTGSAFKALRVDEVAGKRPLSALTKSEDRSPSRERPRAQSRSPPRPPAPRHDGVLGPSLSRGGAPTLNLSDTLAFPISTSPTEPKASPIIEEDEDQLFPLPSPRRTPSGSPAASPNASATSLVPSASSHSHSPAHSPGHSPRSVSPLLKQATAAARRESGGSPGSSPVLERAPSVGTGLDAYATGGRCGRGLLTPALSSSPGAYGSGAGLGIGRASPSPDPSPPHSRSPSATASASPNPSASISTSTSPPSAFSSPALRTPPLAGSASLGRRSSSMSSGARHAKSASAPGGSVRVRSGSAAGSVRAPHEQQQSHGGQHSWTSFFRVGAEVLRGVGSIGSGGAGMAG